VVRVGCVGHACRDVRKWEDEDINGEVAEGERERQLEGGQGNGCEGPRNCPSTLMKPAHL